MAYNGRFFKGKGKGRGKRSVRPSMRRTRKMSSKPTGAFAKKVLSVIHKTSESKSEAAIQNSVLYNSGINSSGEVLTILPSLARGTGDNQRIGDQVTAQRLVLKGHLAMNVNYQTFADCRIAVRLMVVCPKMYSNYDEASTNSAKWLPYLLKQGGTVSAFTGTIQNLYANINTDVVTKYYDKVFYMTIPAYISTTGTTSVNTNTAEDLRSSIRFFRHTFKIKNRVLKYDPGVSTGANPTNYSPIILCGYSHLDGSVPDTTGTQVQLSYASELFYEDN